MGASVAPCKRTHHLPPREPHRPGPDRQSTQRPNIGAGPHGARPLLPHCSDHAANSINGTTSAQAAATQEELIAEYCIGVDDASAQQLYATMPDIDLRASLIQRERKEQARLNAYLIAQGIKNRPDDRGALSSAARRPF
jgi:hypothetical protein